MSSGDRISFFIGVGAIVVTLGVGTCSTNARFNDVNARFNDVNARFNDVDNRFNDVDNRFNDVDNRFNDVNARIDAQKAHLDSRLDAVQQDIRELRALIIDAIKSAAPGD